MNDLTLNMKELLRHYATELWARRWWVVGIVWLVSLAGWFIVARMPDIYAPARGSMSIPKACSTR